MANKYYHRHLGEAIHRAVLDGKLPPNKRPFKKLRKDVMAVIKGMNITQAFDIILTDDVVTSEGGKISIRHPQDERRKNAIKKANRHILFFEHHPLNKSNQERGKKFKISCTDYATKN